MARTAFTAPAHTVWQRNPGQFGTASTVSPDAAPSFVYGGDGLLDHRMPYNKYNALGNGSAGMCIGWLDGGQGIITLDCTPAVAATTNNIAAAQTVTTSTALTLVSVSGAGIVVSAAAFVSMPLANTIPSGTLCVQAIPTYCFIGIRDITMAYDPTSALALAVSITASAGASGTVVFTVRGFDFYGQAMSEQITAATNTTTNGKKAFKWITSVTPSAADGANTYSVGTSVIAGFHLAIDTAPYAAVSANNAAYGIPGTFVAALTSAAPTATNADVRGTCVITNNHTVVTCTPSTYRLTGDTLAANVFTQPPTPLSVGLFGQVQFTS